MIKPDNLPEGVIPEYDWADETLPVSGVGSYQVIDDAVTVAIRANGIVGCGVAVIQGDNVIYNRGFGYSELPGTPFMPETAARCGSLAKPVTALAALALSDVGKLDLDEPILPILHSAGIKPNPVGDTIPDVRLNRILVRHLMDHTSGVPSASTYTAWRPNRNLIETQHLQHVPTSADVASDALGNFELETEPGERYQYANANFVLLACVIEARCGMPFDCYLPSVAMPKFGLAANEIYVSRNQNSMHSAERGINEAAYYQTSAERYGSFNPGELPDGQIFGEAYRGYATDASAGGGGIACTAAGLAKIVANLRSSTPALSSNSIREIFDPPSHYLSSTGFDVAESNYYSKGWNVRYSNGLPWLSHGGMTNHCGGIIGHSAGYQFVAVSNWNSPQSPYVDSILNKALSGAMQHL